MLIELRTIDRKEKEEKRAEENSDKVVGLSRGAKKSEARNKYRGRSWLDNRATAALEHAAPTALNCSQPSG